MNELQPISHGPVSRSTLPAGTPEIRPHPLPVIDMPGPGLKRDYAGVLEYWQMIRRHKGAVVLATFLGGVAGFLMTLSSPRIYQARTTIEIQGVNDDFLNMRNVTPTI